MPAPKLKTWDRRMIMLMEHLIDTKAVDSQRAFLESVNFKSANNFTQILSGKQSFRHEHCYAACKLYNVSMDWMYGLTNEMNRKAVKNQSPIQLLKQAVKLIEEREK